MSTVTLAGKVTAIDDALAVVPHAFGGALALAYYAEPRATIDIDLNVFVPAERFADVLTPLAGLGAGADDPTLGVFVAPRRSGPGHVGRDTNRPLLLL